MKQPNSAQMARQNWTSSPRSALLALAATIALTGCGGGTESSTINASAGAGSDSAGSTGDTTTVTPAKVSLPQALFELSYPQVVNTSYLSATTGSAAKASAAAASPAPTITPTELLNWAEVMFPARFPAGAQNQTNGTLTYRYYAATDVYLGVANNVVYAFGSDTASKIVNAGGLGDFNCSVKPGSCAVIPVQAFTCDAAAITCVEVVSTAGVTQSSVPVTFGQPFKAGDWKHATQGLIAKVDGAQIPLQTDEISSHHDGSARFGVLSAQLNNVAAGQTKIINLYTGTKTSSTPNVPANPDWNLELEAQVYDANGNVVATLVAQPQAQLAAQIASGSGRRLAGAVATEYTVALPFKDKATGTQHPHLTARLHTRLMDGGQRIRTDVVMENTRTWTQAPGNITYSFAVKRNGSTLYTQPKFTHYHHARWHKVLWTGSSAEPQLRVRHNMPYLLESKAVWNYNLALKIPETVMAAQYSLLQSKRADQVALGPMANIMVTPYFPMTGARPDIGPYPRWTASYLVSQEDRALEIMLANADAAGSVPTHYRDEQSDLPLDLDRYPSVSVRFGTSSPALPTVVAKETIWTVDTAHQPSLAYVPYLITGDAFYQDEVMFWASWNLASINPGYRNYGAGLINKDEIRGQAWAMRSIGEASRVLPDSHPLKNYFTSRLNNNLEWYFNKFTTNDPTISPLKAMEAEFTTPGNNSPWMNDYVVMVMAHLAENNESKASETTISMSQFTLGRFQNDSNGFCIEKAPGYYWRTRDANGVFIGTWKALFDANYPGVSCDSALAIDGYPELAIGYAASARAMMAATHNAGVQGAGATYTAWAAMTPKIDQAYASDPTWAIVPR